jgi:hypothetical protein
MSPSRVAAHKDSVACAFVGDASCACMPSRICMTVADETIATTARNRALLIFFM